MKYTVEEVRAQANYEGRATGEPKTEAMLTSYADLLERIKADENAVPADSASSTSKPPQLGGCCCGEPCTLGMVHRTDGPCFAYTQPAGRWRVTDEVVEDGCVAWNKSAGLGYAVADRDCMRAAIEAALAAQGQSPASPAGVPDVVSEVMAELEKAIRKFPTWPTDPLHAVGVFNEEAGELSKAVLQQVYEPHKNAPDDVRKEARQAAAMALRFLVSLDSYDWTPGTQHEQPSLAATPLTIIQDSKVSAADFAAAMRSCGLSLKTFAEVDREARRVAKERAAAPSAPEGE